MNSTTVRTRFVLVLALLVFAMFAATPSALACVVGTGTSASCTEAALDACLAGGGSVTFNCGGAATITVTGGKEIGADTTIDGGSVITISGGGTVGVFSVDSGVAFRVENLTIANGCACPSSIAAGSGGAIDNVGTLTVTNCTFSDNSAKTAGGAISNGITALEDGTFVAGTLTVNNSTFSGNSAAGPGGSGGGAIDNDGGTLTVTGSTFSGNSAVFGGAISNDRVTSSILGTATVINSAFCGNSASGGGAIINIDGSTLTVTDNTFSGNSAGGGGGAIDNGGTATLTNSTFSGNSARSVGGAIESGSANPATLVVTVVTNSTFSGNSAGAEGGAIENGGTLSVTNSTFSGNSAQFGGAISTVGATVTNCTFSGNSARTVGGGAIGTNGTVTLVNSILANSTGRVGIASDNCVFVTVTGTGTITDGGHNIDDGTTCGFTGAGCTTTGSSFCNTNPLLDPAGLASNGGPTQTIALKGESPAINAGNETICMMPPVNNLDQRGFVRPGMGASNCSIGAYEFDAAPSATTTTSTTSATLNICPANPTTTTTALTLIPTTTTTTPTQPTTTTTTLPCTTARCTLGAALMSPACAGQTIPASVTGRFSTAETLIDRAATTPGKKARKVRQKARNLLRQGGVKATRAAKGKKAKLSGACAAALKDAAGHVAAGL